MYDTDGKPDDMPLEEWLWITGQHKRRGNLEEE